MKNLKECKEKFDELRQSVKELVNVLSLLYLFYQFYFENNKNLFFEFQEFIKKKQDETKKNETSQSVKKDA